MIGTIDPHTAMSQSDAITRDATGHGAGEFPTKQSPATVTGARGSGNDRFIAQRKP